MKETISYCGMDSENRYVHFYSHEGSARLCGHNEVFKVRIKECSNELDNTHWAWWENECREFKFTHYNKTGVKMCFPYGFKTMEKNGEGKLLPVVVELY